MSAGFEWAAHPEGHEPCASTTDSPVPAVPADTAVEGILVTLDLDPNSGESPSNTAQSFQATVHLRLIGGSNVAVLRGRGFTVGTPAGDVRTGLSASSLVRDALVVVQTDAAHRDAQSMWADAATGAAALGMDVSEQLLERLPVAVRLTPNLLEWLADGDVPH